MEVFRLKNNSIIIYGAAAIGLIVYDICQDMGYDVTGFIDKRGDEIEEYQGKKVYGIDSEELDSIDRDSVIFVAVKNVFEHENIARVLIDKGFSNLIYRPYASLKGKGNEVEDSLYNIYEDFMKKKEIDIDIPKTLSIREYEYKDYSTICKMKDSRIIYLPIECLFTDKKNMSSNANWLDTPLLMLVPHISFFRFMDQQEGGYSYNKYLDFCIDAAKVKGQIKITERWKENVLKNRADVYTNMNESLEREPDFFVRNAPLVRWNSNGYFNLCSGKHRAAFWVAKGRRYFPVKMSEDDYKSWINELVIENVIKDMRKSNVHEIEAPMEHPYFYNMQCDNSRFYFSLLCEFVYILSDFFYECTGRSSKGTEQRVIVSLNDDGYISRCLVRYNYFVEIYNQSTTSIILEKFAECRNKDVISWKYQYAIIEYGYGDELDFVRVLSENLDYILCIVPVNDKDSFEKIIPPKYNVFKVRNSYRNSECVLVYWLENENAIRKRRSEGRNHKES